MKYCLNLAYNYRNKLNIYLVFLQRSKSQRWNCIGFNPKANSYRSLIPLYLNKEKKKSGLPCTFGQVVPHTKIYNLNLRVRGSLNSACALISQLCAQAWVASFWKGHFFLILMKIPYGLVVYMKTLTFQSSCNHRLIFIISHHSARHITDIL